MQPIRRVLRYLRYFKREMIFNIFFNLLAVLFNLLSFVLIIPFIELLFGLTQPPLVQPELAFNQESLTAWLLFQLSQYKVAVGLWPCLLIVAGGYMVSVLLSNATRYLGLFFLSPIRNGVIRRLRNDLYQRILQLPVSYFSAQRRGDILSRFSNDLADVEWSVVSTLQSLIKDPINVLLFAAVLIFVSPKLFLFFLLVLPLAVWLIARIAKSLKRNSVKGQDKLGRLFSLLDEDLNLLREIQVFGREKERQVRFEEANRDYTRTMIRVARRRELSSPLSEVLGTIGLVAILILGGTLVFRGEIASSVFIFFVIIFARLIPPVQAVVKAYNSLVKGSASAARIFAVIDAPNPIAEAPDAVTLTQFTRAIELRDLSFSYGADEDTRQATTPDATLTAASALPVLNHINLTIPKGTTLAIVGPSGAGKSTLVDLLPRFYDRTGGELLVDGIPIERLALDPWRTQFGIVSQECLLFNDTIAANIAFGQEHYSMERVREAARIANAEEFILQQTQGYDTLVGDRGLMLSGGQRQRISIARAIYSNPAILILDEATSALDTESEQLVQQALASVMKGRTCVVVAHRLSTIRNADQIVVLQQGTIVEQGTHFSLLAQGGAYAQMVRMQSFAQNVEDASRSK